MRSWTFLPRKKALLPCSCRQGHHLGGRGKPKFLESNLQKRAFFDFAVIASYNETFGSPSFDRKIFLSSNWK